MRKVITHVIRVNIVYIFLLMNTDFAYMTIASLVSIKMSNYIGEWILIKPASRLLP